MYALWRRITPVRLKMRRGKKKNLYINFIFLSVDTKYLSIQIRQLYFNTRISSKIWIIY